MSGVYWAGRECGYSGARKGIGGIGAPRGVWAVRGCQGCIGAGRGV